ncbi:E3 ubiquitin-protein ligase RNF8-like [Sipha flava]|nr:E3 ubiquitin-protein ligase RNF8-like [Sipha flava]
MEEFFISRRHCSIRYENNCYFVSDLQSCSGTFLNCKRLSSTSNITELRHGDLIGFGHKSKITRTFKFTLNNISKKNKKPRLYNKHGIGVHTEEEMFEKNIKDLHEVILNLKVDHTVLRDKVKTELVELQNMMNDSMKIKSIQTKKGHDVIQKMTNEIPTLKAKLENELYDVGAPELLKQQIHSQFENELQCSICSKLLCKATVLNCDHTFCEMCIMKRMQKFKSCPVCKAKFKFTSKCITLDNYIIMNQNITGGAKRSAKDVLPSIPPAVEVKKRRRRR